jgi:hypothetical protein
VYVVELRIAPVPPTAPFTTVVGDWSRFEVDAELNVTYLAPVLAVEELIVPNALELVVHAVVCAPLEMDWPTSTPAV